jgi:hypothetical protein
VNVNGIGRRIEIMAETGTGTGTGTGTVIVTVMIDIEDTTMAQVAGTQRGIRSRIPRTQPQRLRLSYPKMRLSGLNKKRLMIC